MSAQPEQDDEETPENLTGEGKRRGLRGPDQFLFNLTQIRQLATIGCTDMEIAAVLHISVETLQRRRKDYPAFAAAMEDGRGRCKATLRRLQWQGAHAGNPTMLIWLGKQMLGQTDKLTIRKIRDWSDLGDEELAVLAQSLPETKDTRH